MSREPLIPQGHLRRPPPPRALVEVASPPGVPLLLIPPPFPSGIQASAEEPSQVINILSSLVYPGDTEPVNSSWQCLRSIEWKGEFRRDSTSSLSPRRVQFSLSLTHLISATRLPGRVFCQTLYLLRNTGAHSPRAGPDRYQELKIRRTHGHFNKYI